MSNTMNLTEEQISEMSMVDIAYEILQSSNKTYQYRELLQEIAKIKGMSEEEMINVIAQLYTEINIDGRFVCVGQGQWGLRRWYSVEKQEDGAEGFLSRDDDEDYDDLDLLDEDEELAEDDERDDRDDYDLLGEHEDVDEDGADIDGYDDFADEDLDDPLDEEFDNLEDEEEENSAEEFVEEDEDF